MGRILVIDDDARIREAFRELLQALGHTVLTADRGESGIAFVETEHPDLVLMDVRMPGMDGLETFRRIHSTRARLPVIIVTGYGTAELAIEATKLGAFGYHLKPLVPEELLSAIDDALECARLMERPVGLQERSSLAEGDVIIGDSPAMLEVYRAIGRVAETDATVLIRGETGTGKELVAQAIYQHSLRRSAPLVVVNCVAIPETLLESELFGHERGAFTGADRRRIGKFEQATGGTLFLDEVGEIPPAVQAKLLRFLQERSIERLGGSELIATDVRVIAATNRSLETAVRQGRFREDLLYRLNVFTVRLPPLRERGGDVRRLALHFLERLAPGPESGPARLSSEALAVLDGHSWPGNVRELKACMQRLLLQTRGYPARAHDVRLVLSDAAAEPGSAPDAGAPTLETVVRELADGHRGQRMHAEIMARVERELLILALRRSNGNRTHAARWLGLSRPTLKAKLDLHRLPDPAR